MFTLTLSLSLSLLSDLSFNKSAFAYLIAVSVFVSFFYFFIMTGGVDIISPEVVTVASSSPVSLARLVIGFGYCLGVFYKS